MKKTLVVVCLAVALAVPAHALAERAPEPIRILSWLQEVWSIIWEGATGTPAEPPPVNPNGDEGHMIDPDG
ncbi:MAG TPA: hypothetical protein VFR31_04135 [Thermoanaerobaculia bacterium]|nr:hypothetical protein [Thermoanaerobaculia bacterium]